MVPISMTLADIEKEVILHRYRFHGNNKTRTASSLGICIRTLEIKLIQYGVSKGTELADVGEKIPGPKVQADPPGPIGRVEVEPSPAETTEQPVPMRKRKKMEGVLPAEGT